MFDKYVLALSSRYTVYAYTKKSKDIKKDNYSKVFLSQFYSIKSKKELSEILKFKKFDLAIVQNLFPLISTSIINLLNLSNVPIAIRLSNYKFSCIKGTFYRKNRVCFKCNNNKIYGIINNCNNNLALSISNTLRYFVFNKQLLIKKFDFIISQTYWYRDFLINNFNFDKDKIHVINNFLNDNEIYKNELELKKEKYVSFIGRPVSEKGFDQVIKLSNKFPNIKFKLTGNNPNNSTIGKFNNIEYVGYLDRPKVLEFIKNSYAVVMPVNWYDVFPSTILECMNYEVPILISNISSLSEIINDEIAFIYDKDSFEDMVNNFNKLLHNSQLRLKKTRKAKNKLLKNYTQSKFLSNFDNIFCKNY